MANGFSDWSSGFTGAARPSWLPSTATYQTPEEDWDRLTSQMQPFWATRAPLADVGRRLRARYLLGAPYMAQQTAGVEPTFAQYLSDFPTRGFSTGQPAAYTTRGAMPGQGYASTGLAELRRRAQEAATAATTAPGAYLGGVDPGSDEFNRRAWLSEQFGGMGTDAAQNQMRVANLLAVQQPGSAAGGVYTGQMADAIRNAMGALYQQRLNVGDPKENFLNWYLSQTA